jgi:GDPmannose 4,6-dehydratase
MPPNKLALITGITGQDGSYLAEFLLARKYEVHGLIRRSSSFNTDRIEHLYEDPHKTGVKLKLHYGDLSDANNLRRILDEVQPDEVYNLGAQSHVRVSFDMPIYTSDINALGTLKLLEAVREFQDYTRRTVRYYQAGTSEMFGTTPESPQRESTPFHPRSPYGVAKLYAHWITVNYRQAYNLHASNGILFNHESPRRGETFVTRKITRAVGRIKHGLQSKLFLGNLDAKRDWGFAGDYVHAMWLMLQQPQPDDYVIATGQNHSVRDFLQLAFSLVNLDYNDFVEVDSRYFRPTEVDTLLGDSSKARTKLNWQPKVNFEQLAKMMVEHDLELAAREKTLRDAGHNLPQNTGHDQ